MSNVYKPNYALCRHQYGLWVRSPDLLNTGKLVKLKTGISKDRIRFLYIPGSIPGCGIYFLEIN